VKCKYCGGTIIVPPYFSGEVRRCSSHPDVLAIGLCNDCGGSFCEACLHFYDVEHGTLHLCSSCFKDREAKRSLGGVFVGIMAILFGLFMYTIVPQKGDGLISLIVFGALGLGFIAYGISKRSDVLKSQIVMQRRGAFETNVEFRGSNGSQATTIEMYNMLLADRLRYCGPELAISQLERELHIYEQAGLTRGEAVRKLGEEKGH